MTGLAAQRKSYLDGLADEALAQQATAEAYREEKADNARMDDRRRSNLKQRRKALEGRRMNALRRAELAARNLINAMGEIHTTAAEEAKTLGQLNESAVMLSPDAVARRLARLLSHALKALPTATQSRYGEMGLARYFPQGARDWIEAEKRAVSAATDTECDLSSFGKSAKN